MGILVAIYDRRPAGVSVRQEDTLSLSSEATNAASIDGTKWVVVTPYCAKNRCISCGSELCREWERLPGAPLHNLYGPTEAAVDVSWYPACGPELAAVTGTSVPIGCAGWGAVHALAGGKRVGNKAAGGEIWAPHIPLRQLNAR
jgi:hypothetical protein